MTLIFSAPQLKGKVQGKFWNMSSLDTNQNNILAVLNMYARFPILINYTYLI